MNSREESLDKNKILTDYKKYIAKYPNLLESSSRKVIQVFLGNTGSGKSSLINNLSQIELMVINSTRIQANLSIGGELALKNNEDPKAMKIGNSLDSETFIPQFIQYQNYLFYDLPGFGDTRGISNTLINTVFIKKIIENANSVKFIFVVGSDEIEARRGEAFKDFRKIAEKCFNQEAFNKSSILVVSKCLDQNHSDFLNQLDIKFAGNLDSLKPWREQGKICKFSQPFQNQINQDDRLTILNAISGLEKKKVTLNVDGIYTAQEQSMISSLIKEEVRSSFNCYYQKVKAQNTNCSAISQIKNQMNEMLNLEQNFINSLNSDRDNLVNAIKFISESFYSDAIKELNIKQKADEDLVYLGIILSQKELEERNRQLQYIEQQRIEEQIRLLKIREDQRNDEIRQNQLREQQRIEQEELQRKRSKFIRSIIGIYSGDTNPSIPNGYVKINQDLNQGAGGCYIYLCYSKEFYHGDPITFIRYTHSAPRDHHTYSVPPASGYQAISSNENGLINTNKSLGKKGDNVGLWTTKESDNIGNWGISDIWLGNFDSGTNYVPQGYTPLGIDLNIGAGGKYIYLAFKLEGI